jgi:ferredoxin/flavodoxin
MSIEIYYFTGTGNSLFIAKELCKQLSNSVIIPISSLENMKTINLKSEIIGIVFPVYYVDIPNIVMRFAKKLEDIKGKYIFAICNYGGEAGTSLKHVKNILKTKGGELSAGFGVHMPQNAFNKPWENYEKLYDKSLARIDFIVKKIISRKKGVFYSNTLLHIILSPLNLLFRLMTKSSLKRITGSPKLSNEEIEDLIYLTDKTFFTNESCNGCGICEKVCPVNNIKLVSKKPKWQNHCESCLACFNWCPQKAIEGGITKGFYYKNSRINLEELTKR